MLYKKELLTIEVPKAQKIPKSFIGTNKYYGEDNIYSGTAVCANLKRSGKILCIDIFNVKGQHKLRFFTDKNNYQVYDLEKQEWNCRKISRGYHTSPCYSTDKNLSTATKFLGKAWAYSLIECADGFISAHERERRWTATERREYRIKQDMELFDTLPEGIDNFVYDTVFPNHIVIGKSDGKKRPARCARCGRRFSVDKKYRHRDEYICPKCGRQSILYEARYINECKEFKSPDVVFAAQKKGDAILYRWFKVWLRLFKDGTQNLVYDDKNREVIRSDKVTTYYWKDLGWYNGAKWRVSKYGRYDEPAYIFPGGLDEVFPDKIRNIYIPAIVKNSGGKMLLPSLVRNLSQYPQTEYLVKMGLIRFASELNTCSFTPKPEDDWNEIVGMSREYLPLLKKFDVGAKELECLKASRTHISEESFRKFRNSTGQYYSVEQVSRLLGMMSFERFANYFFKVKQQYKSFSFGHLAQWYEDYIQMSEALEIDLSHKSVRFPIELKKAHDSLLKRFNEVRSEIEQKTFNRATKNLKTQIHDFHRNGFMVMLPTCEADFVKEGQSLSHCVGNGAYFKEHMKGENIIVFIRKEAEPDTPYVTMQLNLKQLLIRQIYGYADKTPAVEVLRFANEFVQSLRNPMSATKTA